MGYESFRDPRGRVYTGTPAYAGFGGADGNPLADLLQQQQTQAAMQAAKSAAESQIRDLASASWFGPVLAEALDGATNPREIAERAQALAKSFSSQGLDQAAYKLFYGQARAGLDVVERYMQQVPGYTEIADALPQFQKLYGEASSLFQKYEKTGLDASGVADTLSLVRRATTTAMAVGASLGIEPAGAAATAIEWGGVALGCGASIAAGAAAGGVGAIGGAFVCATTVLATVFSQLVRDPSPPTPDPCQTFFGVFSPPADQSGLIGSDAVRLASLLRYRYGVPSWEAFIRPAKAQAGVKVACGAGEWEGGGHDLDSLYMFAADYPVALSQKAVGATMTDVLNILACYYRPGQRPRVLGLLDDVGHQGGAWETWGVPSSWDYGDLPLRPLLQIGRALPAMKVQWSPGFYRYSGYGYASGPVTANETQALTTFTELVTFFAAVTARELDLDPEAYLRPWRVGLPVRFWHAGPGGANNNALGRSGRYDFGMWSRENPFGEIRALIEAVGRRDDTALQLLGALRLSAAVSYLQMAAQWGQPQASGIKSLSGGKDMIAELAPLAGGDPATALRLPVDPRGNGGRPPTWQTLYAKMRRNDDFLANIATAAQRQARTDAMTARAALTGTTLQKFIAASQPGATTGGALAVSTAREAQARLTKLAATGQLKTAEQIATEQGLTLEQFRQQQRVAYRGSTGPAEVLKLLGIGYLALKLLK